MQTDDVSDRWARKTDNICRQQTTQCETPEVETHFNTNGVTLWSFDKRNLLSRPGNLNAVTLGGWNLHISAHISNFHSQAVMAAPKWWSDPWRELTANHLISTGCEANTFLISVCAPRGDGAYLATRSWLCCNKPWAHGVGKTSKDGCWLHGNTLTHL